MFYWNKEKKNIYIYLKKKLHILLGRKIKQKELETLPEELTLKWGTYHMTLLSSSSSFLTSANVTKPIIIILSDVVEQHYPLRR